MKQFKDRDGATITVCEGFGNYWISVKGNPGTTSTKSWTRHDMLKLFKAIGEELIGGEND